jgi:hypothetical protein
MLARPEVGSKEHILLWLATKPPGEEFEWRDTNTCACGQYAYGDHSGIGAWSEHQTLREMNQEAFHHHSFGSLYQAMLLLWKRNDR